MKRALNAMLLVVVAVTLIMLPGCGLTMAEVRQIATPIAQMAADKVAEKAAQEAYERARKAGFTEAAALEVGELARAEVAKVVDPLKERIVESVIEEGVPAGEEKKKSKTGAAVLGVGMALVQLLTGRKA